MPSFRNKRILLLLLLWVQLFTAQKYPSKNFNSANTLPNNSVRALLIDSKNTLWIGTENGVVSKENDDFRAFFEEDGLALNSCWAIAEDKNERLWFGSYGEGLSIYNGVDFKRISTKEGLVHDEITHLYTSGNLMYVGTSDGVSIINIDNFKIQPLENPSASSLVRVQGFFEYGDEVFVTTYNTGILKISEKGDKKILEEVNDHQYIYSIFPAGDSIYSSNKEFFSRNSLKDYITPGFKPKQKHGKSIIWDYCRTRDHRIFAAAWGIYDSSGGIYELVGMDMHSRASSFNIPSNEVLSLAYDPKFEILYVGTKDEGLFEVNLNSQVKFHEFPAEKVLGFSRAGNVSAILTNQGLFLKEKASEKTISLSMLKTWQNDFVAASPIPLPKHEDSFYELDYEIPAEGIRFYDIKSFENQFWINTNIGIFAITPTGKLARYIPLHSEEINFTPAGKLIETHPYGGVRVYNDLDKFQYDFYPQDDPGTPTMVVNSLRLEKQTYCVSVFSGLYKWKGQDFHSYLDEGIWTEKKLRHITSLGPNLAVSSEFGDIFIIEDTNNFEVLKKIPRAKIQGNSILFLKEYQGGLIVGTEKGLNLIKDDRFIFLDEEQGLKLPIFNAMVEGNQLLIGSENGYFSIDLPEVLGATSLIDEIDLKEININNNKSSLQDVNRKNLSLAHDENTVLLRFNTNAHPYPKKLSYQYRLNETEPWSKASFKPEIFLPYLPPDTYNIDLKVLDKSTGLNFSQDLLQLAIRPPYWKTWWFALLVLLILGMGAYSFYRFQLKQVRQFEEQKGLIQKRFEQTKMEALLAQMNPHFIFNAMNSIQNYILDSDIEKATGFLDDFARLIRLNLEHCTRPKILLVEEVEYLESYLRVENTRLNHVVKIDFWVDPNIDQYDVEVPTMIIQPFVENVFVHAFPPQVTRPCLNISFTKLDHNMIQCSIQDNGIGISKKSSASLHSSKGLSLVKERLSLLGYNIEDALKISSEKNRGTLVIIKLEI